MNKYIMYTDGSYFAEDNIAHGGIVFVNADTKQVSACSHVKSTNPKLTCMNNVGGEILAAYSGILSVVSLYESQLANGMEMEIEIHYDYEGVGKWVNMEWRAKKQATQWYVREIQAIKRKYTGLKLNFIWVKGHSGEVGNEVADKVAFWDEEYCKQFDVAIVDMDPVLNKDPSIGVS